MVRRVVLLGGAACAVALLASGPASAATTIGNANSLGNPSCPANLTLLQHTVAAGAPSYAVPSPGGVIVSWSFQGETNPDQIKFKVFRPAGGDNFTVVGASAIQTMTPGLLSTFLIQVPVEAGDIIGLTTESADSACGQTDLTPQDAVRGCFMCDPPPGATFAAPPLENEIRVNVSAVVEPDCDNDGRGDESQDNELNSCPPGPTATITQAPKDKVKTKKKKKKATYEFSANEPGVTFNCVLDGKQEFKACTSPLTVKVKRGKHTFSVTATDAGGNAGAPATDDFKIKRKKK
jgi:hypothetical protein